jgi:hypothetical protein
MPKTNKAHSLHFSHYIVLSIILLVSITAIMLLEQNPSAQLLITVAMSVCYFLWGVIHHASEHDLHPEVVLEYLLIATLGGTILASIIV